MEHISKYNSTPQDQAYVRKMVRDNIEENGGLGQNWSADHIKALRNHYAAIKRAKLEKAVEDALQEVDSQ